MARESRLAKTPTPMAGLALGIASLGWCLENLELFSGYAQFTGALLSGSLLLLLTVKFFRYADLLKQDLSHPVVGSVVPTFSMALMVISVSVQKLTPLLGDAVWLLSVGLHIIFLCSFIYHRSRHFELHQMVPSWFVPPVGIIVAALTFSGNSMLYFVAQYTLYFGMLTYAVMLPIMIYRFMFSQQIQDAAKPTIAILAAPASLSLAGYLSLIDSPSPVVVAVLLGIALLMTVVIYLAFYSLLRLPFSPAYSAFTFPMVIGATALFKVALWMQAVGVENHYVEQVHTMAVIELTIAVVVVGYVGFQYVNHLLLKSKMSVSSI